MDNLTGCDYFFPQRSARIWATGNLFIFKNCKSGNDGLVAIGFDTKIRKNLLKIWLVATGFASNISKNLGKMW